MLRITLEISLKSTVKAVYLLSSSFSCWVNQIQERTLHNRKVLPAFTYDVHFNRETS